MTSWLDHLIIAPIIIPLFAALVMMLIGEQKRPLKAAIGLFSALLLILVSIALLTVAASSDPDATSTARVYRLGDWPALFAIVLVLALLILLLSHLRRSELDNAARELSSLAGSVSGMLDRYLDTHGLALRAVAKLAVDDEDGLSKSLATLSELSASVPALRELHVLDPSKVTTLVSESGRVVYRLSYTGNTLVPGIGTDQVTVPAREVIHDREPALHHPLIGVAPLAAAALPAGKNLHILQNESAFFANGARPSGILTTPAGLSDDEADKLAAWWQKNYTGPNAGKVAIVGADLKYTGFAMSGRDSQLVEQLKFSDEQICGAFGVPAFLVGAGPLPAGLKADDVADLYHRNALQARVEAMEDCLDEGLGLGDNIGVELDLEPLLRMNPERMATALHGSDVGLRFFTSLMKHVGVGAQS